MERLLDAHLYPTQAAAARKSLAFASQDRFLGDDGGGAGGWVGWLVDGLVGWRIDRLNPPTHPSPHTHHQH